MTKSRVKVDRNRDRALIMNNYQRNIEFSEDQIDSLIVLLEQIGHKGVPTDPRPIKDSQPDMELTDIEVYGTATGHNSLAWIQNTRTGRRMYVRNMTHACGLSKELMEYSTDTTQDRSDKIEQVTA